jgi:hypothetical protein
MTNYDVLAANPTFDTLIQVIDATSGLKDKINANNVTFFAPVNNSIWKYLQARTLFVQATIDANGQFGLDSLLYYLQNNIHGTADSMSMYLIKQPLPYSALTVNGVIYPTELSGNNAAVSYEYVETGDQNQGYNPVVSNIPQVVYFTQLWGSYTITNNTPASAVPANLGVHNLCKVSGIVTQNGYMNVLDNSHALFFYDVKH